MTRLFARAVSLALSTQLHRLSSISGCTYSSRQDRILTSKPELSCWRFGLLGVACSLCFVRDEQEQEQELPIELGSAKQISLASVHSQTPRRQGATFRVYFLNVNVCACEKTIATELRPTQRPRISFGRPLNLLAAIMSSVFGNLGGSQPASTSSNLFGSLGATASAQTGSSLFGTSSTLQPQEKSNVFGSSFLKPPASSATPSSSLFASATPQPASTSGGLFGALGTTTSTAPEPPKPSFSLPSLGTSRPAEQSASSNPFASLFASSTQQPPTQSTQALSGSLFGGQPAGPSQTQTQNGQSTLKPAAGTQSAYFDQMLERGKKRNNQDNGNQSSLPGLQLGIGDIARKVRNLGAAGSNVEQPKPSDSRAHYLLAASGVSTASALKDLHTFSTQAGAAVQPTTDGVSDTDIDGYVSELRSQSTIAMIQEGMEQTRRDFDTFLEDTVQMHWDAQRRKIYEHFGLAKANDDLDNGANGAMGVSERGAFGRSSRRARAYGASLSPSGNMSFGPSGMTRSVLGSSTMRGTLRTSAFGESTSKGAAEAPTSAPEDRFQRDKQEKYAEKVQELNQARNQDLCYPILHKFSEVEEQAGIDNTAALTDSYNALISVIGEKPSTVPRSSHDAVPERRFKEQYLNERSSSDERIAMRRQIIQGSRTCLERLFMSKIDAAIAKDPKVANIGGVPEPINRIRAFVRVLAYRRELGPEPDHLQQLSDGANTDYLWVLIYYLLRAGLIKEAGKYVASRQKAIRSIDRNFPRYMAQFAESQDHSLSHEMRAAISTDYQTKLQAGREDRENSDPYQIACYKIIGRCDLSRRALDGIRTDEQDWIWLQLVLVKEVPKAQETAGESFNLDDLQKTVRDIGQRHFSQAQDNSSAVGTFFLLQILTGLFESAIAWLYPHNHIAAVHFAIALDYYGLLRVADLSSTELRKLGQLVLEGGYGLYRLVSYDTREQPRLNFGLMVGYYTADFRAAKPEAAVDYLILLCLNADLDGEAGRQQAELCYEALRELVLETREFAALLGDIRSDGQRIPGAIQQRLKLIRHRDIKTEEDNKNFLKKLTLQAASAADDSGRITDAVLLYHLAGEYDTVIIVCNRSLSEALSVELGQSPLRLEPLKPRTSLQDRQQQSSSQSSQTAGATTSTLSLTAVSDPLTLSKNMMALYSNGDIIYTQIHPSTRDAASTLQNLAAARAHVEAGQWLSALAAIEHIDLVPLNANGDMAVIRSYASKFGDMAPTVTRNVGDLLVWTVVALARERERLRAGEFEDPTRKATVEGLGQAARDLAVYAGLVRYKLPPTVFEALSRAGSDMA